MFFFFSSRRRHTRYWRDWSSDVCSSDLGGVDAVEVAVGGEQRRQAGDPLGEVGTGGQRRGRGRRRGQGRSGERGVGEGGRSLGAPGPLKKKHNQQIDRVQRLTYRAAHSC